MFYDATNNRLIASHPALLAAYPDSGALDNEPDRNALGLYLVREAPPVYDPLTHTLALDGVELVEGIYHARYTLAPLPVDQVRADLMDAATSKRWDVMTGGVTLPGGISVGTTIDDQNRVTSVIANAQLAGVESMDFKAQSGWVTLSLDQVRGIAAAVALHVHACYAAERAHHVAIAAASETELMAYDINEGWPE
jgi:hypothetical protein